VLRLIGEGCRDAERSHLGLPDGKEKGEEGESPTNRLNPQKKGDKVHPACRTAKKSAVDFQGGEGEKKEGGL